MEAYFHPSWSETQPSPTTPPQEETGSSGGSGFSSIQLPRAMLRTKGMQHPTTPANRPSQVRMVGKPLMMTHRGSHKQT